MSKMNVSTVNLFKMATYRLKDIVKSVTFEVTEFYPNSSFNKIAMVDEYNSAHTKKFFPLNESEWTTQRYLMFVRCYTYDVSEYIKRLKV